MASFEITMNNENVQRIDHAEAYGLEGPMTTFFVTEDGHGRLDSWATRLASFRSADVVMIRRVEHEVDHASGRPKLDLIVGAEA